MSKVYLVIFAGLVAISLFLTPMGMFFDDGRIPAIVLVWAPGTGGM